LRPKNFTQPGFVLEPLLIDCYNGYVVNQILGLLMGSISGLVWEKISTEPYKNISTITQSWILKMGGVSIHFHHWLGYLGVLLLIFFIAYKTNRLAHPSALMIFSFLLFAIGYDVWKLSDWYKFVL
jgi:hypothetical protein